jgi:hypothetical protein
MTTNIEIEKGAVRVPHRLLDALGRQYGLNLQSHSLGYVGLLKDVYKEGESLRRSRTYWRTRATEFQNLYEATPTYRCGVAWRNAKRWLRRFAWHG